MIDFHKLSLDDEDLIKEKLLNVSGYGCDYCFGNIFSYGFDTETDVALCCDSFVCKTVNGDDAVYFFPVGGDVKGALEQLIEDSMQYKSAEIFGLRKEDAELFESIYGNRFPVEPIRDAFDYVYDSENLITLRGKKYQPKRNHISFFKKNFDWSYERITRQNIPECFQMSKDWIEQSTEPHEDIVHELEVIRCVFDNYEKLGYVGGLIRIEGKVVAYTMGEELDDEMFCVHFEKAFSDIRGAYPIINQQFVENELSGYKYINREDDVGLENLRKAKLSYHPAFLLEKYSVTLSK